jgi:hypothetical protein
MTPAEALQSHREFIGESGETILIRRYEGSGPNRSFIEASVLARPFGYVRKKLAGATDQGARNLVVLNDPDAAVPAGKVALSALLPLVANSDIAVVRGKELTIGATDDNTRRFAGVLIALQIEVTG